MIDFIRKHLILNVFFLFLGVCLFLGDGQQMLIDVVGAGGVLVFILVAFLYGKRQRELPLTPTLLFGGTILYFCIRTIFSDDIGYSVYTTVRMVEAFIIFYILYCFTTDEDRKVFPTYLLGFCIFSLFASIVYIFTPILSNTLTKSNLLVPTYGHNNVVDILLFGIPVAFFQLISQKKPLYVYIIMFLLFGIIFSFSRTAMMIVVLFLVMSLLFYWKKISLKKRLFLGFFFFSILGILSLLLVIPQTTYKKYVPITILPKMTKQVDGAGNRFEYFRQAINAIKERPLFGSGPGTFLLQSKRLQKTPDSYSRYAHNVLLQELTDVGIVGTVPLVLLFLWFLIHAIRMYRKEQGKKRFTLVVLTLCVLLQTLNALMDFSLNYFVVEMLYISLIATIVSLESASMRVSSHRIHTILIIGSLLLVLIFYTLSSLCSTGILRRNPLFSRFCFLSEFMCTESLKKPYENLKDWELILISQLHKKNSNVLSLLGTSYLDKLVELDPKEISVQKKYFQFLLEKKEYEKAGLSLQSISQNFLLNSIETKSSGELTRKNNLKKAFNAINFLDPSLAKAYSIVDSEIIHDSSDLYISFGKYYYLLGIEVLSSNPVMTEELWLAAMQLVPDWSYFPVELASLYYQNGDYVNAIHILNTCMHNQNASGHCRETSFANMSKPGYFRDDIIRIPKQGTLISKQMNQMENQTDNFLEVLQSIVKKSDPVYLGSYIRELTNFYLEDKEEYRADLIDYSDPKMTVVIHQLLEQDWKGNTIFLAKLYYLLGLEYVDHNSNDTKNMWSIAAILLPDWSYFSVELAALYAHEEDYMKMYEILSECERNENTKDHCLDTSIANIPTPGNFRDNIMQIPNESVIFDQKADQKKTLHALSAVVKTNDTKKIEAFLTLITTHTLKRHGSSFDPKVDLSDKESVQKLSSAITVLQLISSQADSEFLAKLYYLIGYSYLDSSSKKTELFWTLSFHLLPEWSYFPVELASLYYSEGNDMEATKVLKDCQNNFYSADHCKDTNFQNIPKPGFFRNDILIVPKDGVLIKKQFEEPY